MSKSLAGLAGPNCFDDPHVKFIRDKTCRICDQAGVWVRSCYGGTFDCWEHHRRGDSLHFDMYCLDGHIDSTWTPNHVYMEGRLAHIAAFDDSDDWLREQP